MLSRSLKIAEYRNKQSTEELNRKSSKSCRRKGKIWTLEQIEAIRRDACELHAKLTNGKLSAD